MIKIIITGSSGFVGINLVSYLNGKKYSDILKLSRANLNNINQDVINGYDTVIHLAGKAHDMKKSADPEEYYEVNYKLTRNIYDAFLNSDAKKFIFISSVKASADKVSDILTENLKPYPETDYGKSKLMAEDYISSQPLPEGKSYFILRPCMIHGPNNKGNLNLLFNVIKNGIPYPLASFINKRSFLSVENLCFIISELITRNDINSGIYQVADDEALSTNDVIKILASSLGKKPKLWHVSPILIKMIAKIGDKLHLPLTSERLEKLTESYVVSNEKLMKIINKPMPFSAKEGLLLTANSFLNLNK